MAPGSRIAKRTITDAELLALKNVVGLDQAIVGHDLHAQSLGDGGSRLLGSLKW